MSIDIGNKNSSKLFANQFLTVAEHLSDKEDGYNIDDYNLSKELC